MARSNKDSTAIVLMVMGIFSVIIGLIYMAIAAAAFNIVTNVALGAWWAGMVVAISGVLTALNMKSKGMVTIACVMSVVAIIVVIAGIALDASAFNYIEPLSGCYNTDNNDLYGDEGAAKVGILCQLDDDADAECLCQEDSSSDECYEFDLRSGDDCNKILDNLPALLRGSYICGIFSLILVIVQSITCCAFVCSSAGQGAKDDEMVAVPAHASQPASLSVPIVQASPVSEPEPTFSKI